MSRKPLLIIDFYDSFTYNLVHYFEEFYPNVEVEFYDKIIVENLIRNCAVILSPGPGKPEHKKNLNSILNYLYSNQIPTLGICLGFQAIAQYMGSELRNLSDVNHGKSKKMLIQNPNSILFKNLPPSFLVGLYHSWEVKFMNENLISAVLEDGTVMSAEYIHQKFFGVQFHPESVLTENGKQILSNFIDFALRSLN